MSDQTYYQVTITSGGPSKTSRKWNTRTQNEAGGVALLRGHPEDTILIEMVQDGKLTTLAKFKVLE